MRSVTCDTVVWCFLDPDEDFLDHIACSITLSASSFCVSLSGWSIPPRTNRLWSGRSTGQPGGFLQAITWGILWGRWSVARPSHMDIEPGWRITTVEACSGYKKIVFYNVFTCLLFHLLISLKKENWYKIIKPV